MPKAQADFEKISEYYLLYAPHVERAMVGATYEGISLLESSPWKGRSAGSKEIRQVVIVNTPYVVTY